MNQLSGESRAPLLCEVWADYQKTRRLKASTRSMYDERLKAIFYIWLYCPIDLITKDAIEDLHQQVTRDRGAGTANLSFRILRSLFNFAMMRYEDAAGEPIIKKNPVKRLSDVKAWNPEEPRQNYVPPADMHRWYQGVRRLRSKTPKDYLVFLALTGCRRSEAAGLMWDNVDLEKGQVMFVDTKNRRDHRLAIAQYLVEMLRTKREFAPLDVYVFRGEKDRPYFICTAVQETIAKHCGIFMAPHGLRRSYATMADAMHVPHNTIKRLLNHVDKDMTMRYVVYDCERYRPEIEAIASVILSHWGVNYFRELKPISYVTMK